MRSTGISIAAVLLCAVSFSFGQSRQSIWLDAPPVQGIQDNSKLIASPDLPSSDEQQFRQAIHDVHFDFDKADLRDQDRQILASDAEWLKAHPNVLITLEGDADDRGDVVYNLVLGGERAETTRQALLRMGVPPDRIAFSTGWGKLYPVCTQDDDSCWSQNRRTHISTWPPEDQATSTTATATPSITLADH